jgi:dihydroneopterin aldolase
MGVASSEDDENPQRVRFQKVAKSILSMVTAKAMNMLDAAADQVCNACQIRFQLNAYKLQIISY